MNPSLPQSNRKKMQKREREKNFLTKGPQKAKVNQSLMQTLKISDCTETAADATSKSTSVPFKAKKFGGERSRHRHRRRRRRRRHQRPARELQPLNFCSIFFATDVSNFCNCEISCKIRQKKDNIWSLL